MNKAELKAAWGKYCDTDKLVETTMQFLSKYRYKNTEHGVCSMLNTYFTNKRSLIELLAKSNHYLGNMRIALDVEIERDNSRYDVQTFCYSFMDKLKARPHIVKTVDEDGKKLEDYLTTGIKRVTPKDFTKTETLKKLQALSEKKSRFNAQGEIKKTIDDYQHIFNFFYYHMSYKYMPTIGADTVTKATELPHPVKLAEGMKTSRAFNRVCVEHELDKLPMYNKLFAEYADLVAGGKRKLKFFISVNPLDYLTMSFGVNWTSCHSTKNHGGWCGGCLSYMLDNTSIVTYVHTDIPTDFEEGKIYRNMFHYENDVLIQSRIYPKENDGSTDLYKVFRNFVQDELTELLGLESGTWVVRKEKASVNIEAIGVQYHDYDNIPSCNASYPKERGSSKENIVHIGHNRVCPNCGNEITNNSRTSSLICPNGCII